MNIVFKDSSRIVYLPDGDKRGDLFIKDKATGLTLRVGNRLGCIVGTAHTGRLEPSAVNNVPAFLVVGR